MSALADEIRWLDAVAQAELVRSKQIAAEELVESTLTQIHRYNPPINAIVSTLSDALLVEGQRTLQSAAPLFGVPLLLKDLGACDAGMPYYQGNRALLALDHRSPFGSPLASRFKKAGFVVIGKTNTAEFGMQPTTQPLAFGATRNPWDLARSSGGSSGGSAAAVASGIVPVAHGTDSGGSIRIPSAWCGVVGLKPSRGRTSTGDFRRNLVEHVITRSVRDTAIVLDAVCGPEPGDLYTLPRPREKFSDRLTAQVRQLRVGLLANAAEVDVQVDRSILNAVEEVARQLDSLGHRPEWVELPVFDAADVRHAQSIDTSNAANQVRRLAQILGREARPDDMEPYTWAAAEAGERVSAAAYLQAAEWQQNRAIQFTRDWVRRRLDLLVTPTVPEQPPKLEQLIPPSVDAGSFRDRFRYIWTFTSFFNLTGQPAITLPWLWDAEGLPVGIQLIAAMGAEGLLLQVAHQLELAKPWHSHYLELNLSG